MDALRQGHPRGRRRPVPPAGPAYEPAWDPDLEQTATKQTAGRIPAAPAFCLSNPLPPKTPLLSILLVWPSSGPESHPFPSLALQTSINSLNI